MMKTDTNSAKCGSLICLQEEWVEKETMIKRLTWWCDVSISLFAVNSVYFVFFSPWLCI